MREKLIELLDAITEYYRFVAWENSDKIADYLIANGVTVQEWISVKDMLPEEHDCFFTSYYGTNKWQDGMFRQISDTVLAVVEYEDGKIRVKATVTKDGKWDFSKFYRASKVTHWMPLPQPPKGE